MADLAKSNSALTTTEKQSSRDLVLARMLDLVSQIYGGERFPGEVRVWQRCLREKSPEVIEGAFLVYFERGKFPPKPADIMELVRLHEETVRYDVYQPCDATERDQAQASRQEYFDSAEYKQLIARLPQPPEAKPISPTPVIQLTAEQIAARRDKEREEIEAYLRNGDAKL